jgi:hypothetical protein
MHILRNRPIGFQRLRLRAGRRAGRRWRTIPSARSPSPTSATIQSGTPVNGSVPRTAVTPRAAPPGGTARGASVAWATGGADVAPVPALPAVGGVAFLTGSAGSPGRDDSVVVLDPGVVAVVVVVVVVVTGLLAGQSASFF